MGVGGREIVVRINRVYFIEVIAWFAILVSAVIAIDAITIFAIVIVAGA